MIKNIFSLLLILTITSVLSQETNFDKYQYIIVLDRFDFLKESDQYQTSSLTKFLLNKKGFKVFLSSETLPNELNNNRCLALVATVKDDSSMFTTKNAIEIKDCLGKVLYTSSFGSSKLKLYEKAYHEAIRDAFNSMTDFNYSYNPDLVKNMVDEKNEVVIAKNSTNVIISSVKKNPVIIPTPEIKVDEKNKNISDLDIVDIVDILYAQAKDNGFQLVNTKPEVVFLLLKTSLKDVFLINDNNGIFYKNGDFWVAEYYKNDTLIAKKYQIKF
ncbi:MAG: hypothetical protein WAO74_06740 [Polaribacter sp.]|uniref:hypothetical protein n=1 Tax=Polaribacter sp. TaxID=1920175 RepID=UPI003BAE2B03